MFINYTMDLKESQCAGNIHEIDQKKEVFINANDRIWEFAETAFLEYKSVELLCEGFEKEGFKVFAPPMKYCTDNATMVASCAYFNKSSLNDINVEVFSRIK